jgi:PqqD family protein of HPr-rel-A system
LAPPAPEILEALAAGPADIDTILERLRVTHELSGDDARAAIAARLNELEASGLVWRA